MPGHFPKGSGKYSVYIHIVVSPRYLSASGQAFWETGKCHYELYITFYLKAGLLNFLDGAIFCLIDPVTGVNVLILST